MIDETDNESHRFIGLDLGRAIDLAFSRKLKSRVVKVDGQGKFVLSSFDKDRINFEVEDGRISKAFLG